MKRIYTRTGDKGMTGIHGGTRVPKDDIRIEANGCLDELNCQIGIVRSQLRSPSYGWVSELQAFRCEQDENQSRQASDSPSEAERRAGSGAASISLRAERNPEPQAFFCEQDENQSHEASDGERCPVKPDMTERFDEILHEIQRNLMTVMSLVATPTAERKNNPNTLPDNLVAACEASMDTLSGQSGPSLHFLLPGGTPLAARLQLARAICRRAERRLWTLHHQDPVPEEILQYINRLSDLLFVMARCELARQKWPEERWHSFSYKNKR